MIAWEWLIVAVFIASALTALAAGIGLARWRTKAVAAGGFLHGGKWFVVEGDHEVPHGAAAAAQAWRGNVL